MSSNQEADSALTTSNTIVTENVVFETDAIDDQDALAEGSKCSWDRWYGQEWLRFS